MYGIVIPKYVPGDLIYFHIIRTKRSVKTNVYLIWDIPIL